MNDANEQTRIKLNYKEIDDLICEWDMSEGTNLYRAYANKGMRLWYLWHEWAEKNKEPVNCSLLSFTNALRRVIEQGRIDWSCDKVGRNYRYMKRKTGKMITRSGCPAYFVGNHQLDNEEVEAWLTEMGWTDLDAPDKLMLFKLRWSPT